jgi:hypothetical protein
MQEETPKPRRSPVDRTTALVDASDPLALRATKA